MSKEDKEKDKKSVTDKSSHQKPDKAPNLPSDDVIMPDVQPMAKRPKGKSASKNKLENQTNQDVSAATAPESPEKGKENINLDQLLDSLDPKKDNEELIKRTQVNDTPTTQVDANNAHSKPPAQQQPEAGATKHREKKQAEPEKIRVGSAEKKTTLDKAKEVFPVLDKKEVKKDATNTKLYLQGKKDNKGRSFKEDMNKIKGIIPSELKDAAKGIGQAVKTSASKVSKAASTAVKKIKGTDRQR